MFFLLPPHPHLSQNAPAGLFDLGELFSISTQRPQGRYLIKQTLLKTILEVQ